MLKPLIQKSRLPGWIFPSLLNLPKTSASSALKFLKIISLLHLGSVMKNAEETFILRPKASPPALSALLFRKGCSLLMKN